MPAVELDKLTWPEVKAELEAGRDTVVVAFGATEQHGPHMPLATDALLGDELARLVADRLDAFVAPTVRVGCSAHHLDFPGTLSLEESTFGAIVGDLVRSLARGGFRRVVLLPTHGGNFAPLAAALGGLSVDGVEIVALTDITALLRIANVGAEEYDVPLGEGGLHAGEWEASMLMALEPSLVRMDRAEAGFTGDLQEAVERMFAGGTKAVSENGAIGDPSRASVEHGRRYWDVAVESVMEQIED
ncbi:MAG TPA: creatininase family protein [Thermoleophilaceae bacterium]|jgi:creatinine amidohydrolase